MIIEASVLIVALLFAVYEYLRRQPEYVAAKAIPGYRMYPIVGDMIAFTNPSPSDTIRIINTMATTFRESFRIYFMGMLHYWPIKASEIEFLMNSSKHNEKSFFYHYLRPMLGDGLLLSRNTKWNQRRKILTPAFHFNILEQFLPIFSEGAKKFVDDIDNNKYQIENDLKHVIARFTLNNVCETAMGFELNSSSDPDHYLRKHQRSADLVFARIRNPIYMLDWTFSMTGIYRELHSCVKHLKEFSGSVIKERRRKFLQQRSSAGSTKKPTEMVENTYEKKKRRYAMLETLLEAEFDGGQIDSAGIQEEVDTFIFEGFDTTSSAIMFSLFMIATHQKEQQGLFEEISALIDQKGEDLGYHDYSELKLLDRVLKETLRLYPPVPYLARKLSEPVHLDKAVLPVGTHVHLMLPSLHRDPEQFPQPDKFDPDRFLPENLKHRHPFAYIPFSAGPRNCIGQKFAWLEMKTLIVKILQKFRLEAITKVEDVVLTIELVLRTEDPIKIRFVKR